MPSAGRVIGHRVEGRMIGAKIRVVIDAFAKWAWNVRAISKSLDRPLVCSVGRVPRPRRAFRVREGRRHPCQQQENNCSYREKFHSSTPLVSESLLRLLRRNLRQVGQVGKPDLDSVPIGQTDEIVSQGGRRGSLSDALLIFSERGPTPARVLKTPALTVVILTGSGGAASPSREHLRAPD